MALAVLWPTVGEAELLLPASDAPSAAPSAKRTCSRLFLYHAWLGHLGLYSGCPPILGDVNGKFKEQHGSRTDIEPRTPAVFEGQWKFMKF